MAYTQQKFEIPLGTAGMTGSRNLAAVLPTYLEVAENITYQDGTLQKEPGCTLYTPAALPGAVLGGVEVFTDGGLPRTVVAVGDGTLRKDAGLGTFPTVMASGLSPSMRPFFVSGGAESAGRQGITFLFTGTNPVFLITDDAPLVAALPLPPADWAAGNHPTCGVLHENRLWGAGNANDPNRLYYSTPTNHGDFQGSGSGTLSVFPSRRTRIVALHSYNGRLLVWKYPKGIFWVDTSPVSPTQWRPILVSDAVGAVSPRAIVPTEFDLIFQDATGGVQSLGAVQESSQVSGRQLSHVADMDTWIRAHLNLQRLDRVSGVYYSSKREIHFTCTARGAQVNNRRLVLDFNVGELPRWRVSSRDGCESIWLQDDQGVQRPMVGDAQGQVWRLDQSGLRRGTEAYRAIARTVPNDFSAYGPEVATLYKNAQALEVIYRAEGDHAIDLVVTWDGQARERLVLYTRGSGAPLGSFVLDRDRLAGSGLDSQVLPLTGRGKRMTFEVSSALPGQGFDLAKAFLYAELADE